MRAAGTGLLALALVLAPVLGAATASAASAASTADDAPDVDRTIRDGRIKESSGLAVSLRHQGVLWTLNDSGNSPRIYAIGTNGRTEAAVRISSEENVDWEAITSFRMPAGVAAGGGPAPGTALLGIGDIGDNRAQRDGVRVVLVREPEDLRSTTVDPVRVLRLRYPDGPRDAEALLADPRDGRLYVVSKNLFGAELYAVPERVWPEAEPGADRVSKRTEMTKVATLDASFVTDGTFLPDGRMLLRGYDRLFLLDRPESVRDGRVRTLESGRLPDQEQGESVTLAPGGRDALVGSEGRREPVLRVPIPGGPVATLPAAEPVPTPEETTRSGTATSPAPAPDDAGAGGARTWTAVIAAGAAVAGLTLAWLRLSTRRRR